MRRPWLLDWIVITVVAGWTAPLGLACSEPPVADPPVYAQAECRLLFPDGNLISGEPFRVEVTVSNLGPDDGGPPFLNDQNLFIVPTVLAGRCDGLGSGVDVDPGEGWLFLDDSTAPSTDQPTTGTFSFIALPPNDATPGSYLVSVHVQKGRDGGAGLTCDVSECIEVVSPIAMARRPIVEFVEPVLEAASGDAVPFRLRLQRNGRPLDEPLTLRVIPANASDPVDLFPLEPVGLDTTGMILVGEEVHDVSFTCHVHGPCYVGVSNEYHVTVHSGDELLCDSRWTRESGMARVLVGEANLVRWDVLEILDETGDGRFEACEPGRIRVRAAVRNPWVSSILSDTELEIPLSETVDLVEYEIVYHDNPMDSIDPTAAQLETGATLVETPAGLRVTLGDLLSRELPGAPGPVVFRDLVDIDLLLEIGPEGPGDVFGLWGPTVTGLARGAAQSHTAEPLVFRTGPDPAPSEIAGAGSAQPLLFDASRDRWTWGIGDGSAASFVVQRGRIPELRLGYQGDCLTEDLHETEWLDGERPDAGGWFYLVSGASCGRRGPAGFSSEGGLRYSDLSCR